MNMDILLVPIVGAVIGYFTNWLAIKMLFLPRKEYRVFGIRLPFTPGVLPKSKSVVAHNIGNTVGDYVLTDETLKKAIMDTDLDKELLNVIDVLFEKLKSNDNTVEYYLTSAFGLDYGDVMSDVKESAVKLLSSAITSGDSKEKIGGFICELTDNTFEIIVKPEQTEKIKELTRTLMPTVFSFVKDALENNQELDKKIYELVQKLVQDSVGQFIGGFVYKSIHASLKKNASVFLSDEKNMESACQKLYEMVDKLKDSDKDGINQTITRIYPDYGETLRNFFTNEANSLIDKYGGVLCEKLYDEVLSQILSIKISSLANAVGSEGYSRLKDIFNDNKYKIIDWIAATVISKLNIKKIVEDKINSLEVKEMEDIVLRVAKRELNYITYMGGLLGFIMGFLPELIKRLSF